MKFKESIIKFLSLGVGLAVGVLLLAKVSYELSHDKCYSDYERIYQIRLYMTQQGATLEYGQVSGAIAPGFKQYIPGVESATRTTFIWDSDRFRDENRNIIVGSAIVADTSFFDIFDTQILIGDCKDVLGRVAYAMVSESFANKLGGVEAAVGKTVENENLPGFKVTIGGVFKDFPYHSSVKCDFLLSMESLSEKTTQNWVGNDRYRGYVKLLPGTNPDMLSPAIRDMQMKNQNLEEAQKAGIDFRYYLVPVASVYTSDTEVRNTIMVLSVVSLLLVVISLLNYILMSVSALVKRSKVMGVHKCYGAGTSAIYGIMAKEALLDMVGSVAVAVIIILSSTASLEDITGVPTSALLVPMTYFTSAGILLLMFVVAAVVPGYLYSKIPVSAVFRGYSESKRLWKQFLLFAQVTICAFLLSMISVISAQYEKAVNDNPGYNYDNLLWTELRGTDNSLHSSIIEQLKQLPEVEAVEMSYSLPLEYSSGNNVYMNEGANAGRQLFNIADQYEGTEGLFKLLEIPFVVGRYPQTDDEVAVSESFLQKMAEFEDWSDGAVGKRIWITEHSGGGKAFTVCGVYKDYRINTLTNQDERASVKFFSEIGSGYMPFMAIKVNNLSPEVISTIEKTIQSRIDNKEIEVNSYADSMRDAYSGERRMRNTIMVGSIVSILVAIFGLMGYVRDESQRRSKEMAIRKISGAVTGEIINIYVKGILKFSVAALILGNIGAWFVSSLWLENFSEKVALSPWFFIIADCVVILIVSVTIVVSSLRIAGSNPIKYLKSE